MRIGLPDAIEDLFGSGVGGMQRLFPLSTPKTSCPFPRAARVKHRHDYDGEMVARAINSEADPDDFVDIDPRLLQGTQPAITRAGVDHYNQNDYRKAGRTFADHDQPGNKHPLVYGRLSPDGGVAYMLLAGHHRATSDLLAGRPVRARHLEGPWGAPR
ncbi:MAG: hypothetical protein M3083_00775 [Actinomycetota bacterium]|nr:hypothetical protein [Actinomycetota bacterium]MDQ6944779.1 hypothetical protein [Actinomycetota bacterium]